MSTAVDSTCPDVLKSWEDRSRGNKEKHKDKDKDKNKDVLHANTKAPPPLMPKVHYKKLLSRLKKVLHQQWSNIKDYIDDKDIGHLFHTDVKDRVKQEENRMKVALMQQGLQLSEYNKDTSRQDFVISSMSCISLFIFWVDPKVPSRF